MTSRRTFRPDVWAGVVPVETVLGSPQPATDCELDAPVPADVAAIADRPRC
jgi:hypothetical protein